MTYGKPELYIPVFDEEPDRRAATVHVLSTAFPNAEVEDFGQVDEENQRLSEDCIQECLDAQRRGMAVILFTDIDGVSSEILQPYFEELDDPGPCLVTTCWDGPKFRRLLSSQQLDDYDIRHIHCPVSKSSDGAGNHRRRVTAAIKRVLDEWE